MQTHQVAAEEEVTESQCGLGPAAAHRSGPGLTPIHFHWPLGSHPFPAANTCSAGSQRKGGAALACLLSGGLSAGTEVAGPGHGPWLQVQLRPRSGWEQEATICVFLFDSPSPSPSRHPLSKQNGRKGDNGKHPPRRNGHSDPGVSCSRPGSGTSSSISRSDLSATRRLRGHALCGAGGGQDRRQRPFSQISRGEAPEGWDSARLWGPGGLCSWGRRRPGPGAFRAEGGHGGAAATLRPGPRPVPGAPPRPSRVWPVPAQPGPGGLPDPGRTLSPPGPTSPHTSPRSVAASEPPPARRPRAPRGRRRQQLLPVRVLGSADTEAPAQRPARGVPGGGQRGVSGRPLVLRLSLHWPPPGPAGPEPLFGAPVSGGAEGEWKAGNDAQQLPA